jgi:hypothetical protein
MEMLVLLPQECVWDNVLQIAIWPQSPGFPTCEW